jgi:DNA mismatch repair protein MutL
MSLNNMQGVEQSILILPPEEARKIAAGEVIDRPAALVREFLDNAIDAKGSLIEVIIEEGGVSRTEVIDDGGGMGKEDLSVCCLPHATSKIRSLNDLKTLGSLGFRGEALAAEAAVSRLENVSRKDGREAWKLISVPEKNSAPVLEQCRRTKGTSVRTLGLYDTIPARRRFLKRAGSEALSCRQVFNEKALAFPQIAFKFTQDGVLKSFLPPVSSLKERFCQIYLEGREEVFLHEVNAAGNGFSVSVVAGGIELFRSDRRFQFVIANSRRIQDFSLLQALEYGLQGWFPNGTHPIGAIFVTIDPALADFNIHPAKREVRFADPGAIHHAVTSALRDFCRRFSLIQNSQRQDAQVEAQSAEEGLNFFTVPLDEAPVYQRESYSGETEHAAINFAAERAAPYKPGNARYLGRLFGLFILVEKNEALFLIDQHAAHERILFERFLSGHAAKQELLVPIPFSTESPEDDLFLKEKQEEFARFGVVFKKSGDEWLIEALPSPWKLTDAETVAELLNLRNAGENITERLAAAISCRAAVKEGDYLDGEAALALAEEAFALPSSRCPHGRPIWVEIKRDDLLRAVKRK